MQDSHGVQVVHAGRHVKQAAIDGHLRAVHGAFQ